MIWNDATQTLWTGMLFTLASAFVGVREILLRPENPRFPKAPFVVRLTLFFYVVVLFGLGTSALFSLENNRPVNWGGGMLLLAIATVVNNGFMAINLMRQRYPARFWNRVDGLFERAECQGDRVHLLGIPLWTRHR